MIIVPCQPHSALSDLLMAEVVADLKAGRFLIAPTDTVYGLFCDALNPDAVKAVVAAKGRDVSRAMPVAVAGPQGALAVAAKVPEAARRLIQRFWPGALTLLLPAREALPAEIVSNGKVGVRAHDHPLVRSLVQAMGGPLVSTSANLSGGPEPTGLDLVDIRLKEQASWVFDQGRLPAGRPSTVVDVTIDPPHIVREGLIPASDLFAAI